MADAPALPTRVAHAGWDEHGFCGYRLFGDLAGSTSIWSLLSLAGGGPRLSAGDAQVLGYRPCAQSNSRYISATWKSIYNK